MCPEPPEDVEMLKPLHPERLLSLPKLASFRKLATADLIDSLKPGQIHAGGGSVPARKSWLDP